MKNKNTIGDKEYKNITIVDTNNKFVAVIFVNGDVITNNKYQIKLNAGD